MNGNILGERIRQQINNYGVTERYFAEEILKISYDSLRSYISGRRTPTQPKLEYISRCLGCTPEYLLGLSNNKYNSEMRKKMNEAERHKNLIGFYGFLKDIGCDVEKLIFKTKDSGWDFSLQDSFIDDVIELIRKEYSELLAEAKANNELYSNLDE